MTGQSIGTDGLTTRRKTTVAYATMWAKLSGMPAALGSPGLPRGDKLATVMTANASKDSRKL